MKNNWSIALYIIFSFFLVIFQIGFINVLPGVFSHLNLILIGLVIFLFFFNFDLAFYLGLILGLLLDIFSFEFFGVYSAAILVTVLLLDFLSENWLTNKSVYSFLVLTGAAIVVYNFILYFLIYLSDFLGDRAFFLWSKYFWQGIGLELAWGLSTILVFFIILGLTTNRLKPVFLDKK